jgi:hypothetical protein
MVPTEPSTRPGPRSLWQDLGNGTAGPGTRLLVSLVAGLLLVSAVCMVSSLVGMTSSRGRLTIRVHDEAFFGCLLMAAIAYLPTLYWVWSRHRKKRFIWLGGALTVGIGLAAIALSMAVDASFAGSDELLLASVWFFGIGAVLTIWLFLYRRYAAGRPMFGEGGQLDLRCPGCNYLMVGLHEARCPECGRQYTIDNLIVQQEFAALQLRRSPLDDEEPHATTWRSEQETVSGPKSHGL